ncbi:hypothetical protein Athai_57660 [Actinocatenispora thailandica]|uniref:PPE family domain-containing protein n=1 Tax=Actinocatenispora thailandica TaxID=227318 RepID=A0A7R7DUV4_9ACTN|nr:hypothetical protein [Actinocatenispora thailandica]BCJ38263.1 hypothetical protein Athai_57660 [Actinocatenispora thailandica]
MDHVGDHSYQQYSHEQLRAMLDSARPKDVEDTHVVAWHRVSRALADLTAALDATIGHGDWSGPAADEFHRRLSATKRCSSDAGDTSGRLSLGLNAVAHLVADAQAQMPDVPTKNVLNPNAVEPDGTVGASQGYLNQIPVRKQASDAAQVVMASLGSQMQVTTESTFPAQVAPAPADLPGSASTSQVSLRRSTAGAGPSAVPPTGHGNGAGSTTTAGQVPTVQITAPHLHGTELAGSGVSLPAGGAGGAGPAGLAPGGVGAVPGAGSGALPTTPGVAVGSGLAAANGAPGNPRLAPGAAGEEPLAGRAGNPMVGSSAGRRIDDPDEHHTWLTEDDMVWQARQAPPGLIE